MKKILFPTDFSPEAHNAYQYAVALAKETGAKIDLIHVYDDTLKGEDFYLDLTQQRELRVKRQKQKEVQLLQFVNQYDFKNLGDKLIYPGVFIDQEIIDRSKRGCDLIVMGTKGERNSVNKFMGSVTTQLMMNASCPVLAIPSNANYNGMEEIVYATTFSSKDQHFVEKLVEFGNHFKAKIHFVHVTKDTSPETREERYIEGLSSGFARCSIINNPSVMDGVDNFLKDHPANALALYIPKRNLWEQLFHTSFTKKMTFHTNIPLFVFHE